MSKYGSRSNANEWSLVVFTLALQLGCGLAFAVSFLDFATNLTEVTTLRPVGIAIFPVVGVGLLVSAFHLGRPFRAWKSLANVRSSRLSREVLLSSLFAFAALIYSAMWLTGAHDLRHSAGLATSVFGLAAVVSSALIYTIPTQPFWNSGWLPASFLGTTLLLGGTASMAMVSPTNSRFTVGVISAAIFAGGVALLLSAVWARMRFSRLCAVHLANAGQPCGLGAWQRASFMIHVALAVIVPTALAFIPWTATAGVQRLTHAPLLIAFLAIAVGISLGRALMYSLASSLPRF